MNYGESGLPEERIKYGVRWTLASRSAWQRETKEFRVDVSSTLPFGRKKVSWSVRGFLRGADNVLRPFADCSFTGEDAEDMAFRVGAVIHQSQALDNARQRAGRLTGEEKRREYER